MSDYLETYRISLLRWNTRSIPMLNLLLELQGTRGFSLVFVTHDPRLMAAVAAGFVVLDRGAVIERVTSHGTPVSPIAQSLFEAAGMDTPGGGR